MMAAVTNGHLEVTRYLKEQGADMDTTDLQYGYTLLFTTSGKGVQAALWLIRLTTVATPLSPLLAYSGHLEVCRYLVEHCAENRPFVMSQDATGATASSEQPSNTATPHQL